MSMYCTLTEKLYTAETINETYGWIVYIMSIQWPIWNETEWHLVLHARKPQSNTETINQRIRAEKILRVQWGEQLFRSYSDVVPACWGRVLGHSLPHSDSPSSTWMSSFFTGRTSSVDAGNNQILLLHKQTSHLAETQSVQVDLCQYYFCLLSFGSM